jgi:Ca-activated chloride channel family protein
MTGSWHFSHAVWLLMGLAAVPWVLWLAWTSDVQISPWRRWISLALRLAVVAALILAAAGLEHLKPVEGMNLFYLLDRSLSVSAGAQEQARQFVNKSAAGKGRQDRAGVIVFGADAAIESSPNAAMNLEKVLAVVDTGGTDIAGAVRLATAAFPETGQKRLVLLSDGNENAGEAEAAVLSARTLGVTVDVLPLGSARANDVSIQRLGLPSRMKRGQTFDVRIFAHSDQKQRATLRLYQNDQFLGEQPVELEAGKNLFTFPQTLQEPGFYSYSAVLDAPGDPLPQNNRAAGFTTVKGNPVLLFVSSDLERDASLIAALRTSKLEVRPMAAGAFQPTLAELGNYDVLFLSNVAAGDLGRELMTLIGSAVRDFGVGLVCIGGDQAFAAGGYRGTPLEEALPVDMELNSKKALPSGALAIVCHATEFPNGNDWARQIAFAALDALGPSDEMGIVLWNGNVNWLFPLSKVGSKSDKGKLIMGMNPGDMPSFVEPMTNAYAALKKSASTLKHMVVFSDGDPGPPSDQLVNSIVNDKITISTVMIGGHVTPEVMERMAGMGGGRFYDVHNPEQLPQIFIKEAAVILKSAIFEEPFKPRQVSGSELIRGIGAGEYPMLRGYVCTTAKPRAEVPLVTEKQDPLLAHWQFGLGRAVAFTSDAKAKWASDWIAWGKYRQFWSQVAQWAVRRVEDSDFAAETSVEEGAGRLGVDAVDAAGNYRNFLNLKAVVVSPKGDRQTLPLEQTGPGHYEARFPARETGSYLMNILHYENGVLAGSQLAGASVNYSPEFNASGPNLNLLARLAALGGGTFLDPASGNPFSHDRELTRQPRELFERLLELALLLFPLDVGVRRIQIGGEEWRKAAGALRRRLLFWRSAEGGAKADAAFSALLVKRDEARAKTGSGPKIEVRPELFQPKQALAPVRSDAHIELSPLQGVSSPQVADETKPSTEAGAAATTTSRLLAAKNRPRKPKGE